MTTRTRSALLALLGLLVLAPAASATVTAHLRVLTPDRVLDPGTTYIVDEGVTVPTRADADCFGPPGGSGAEYTYEKPNALSLLATAGRTTKPVAPLALTDQFEFGLGICGIGGQEAKSGESFWYFKANHEESTLGADQLEISDGDEILFYLAPDNFPNPNPAELELEAPARVITRKPFELSVIEHKCTTNQASFETTCTSGPAAGVTVSGIDSPATTGADGTAEVTISDLGVATLTATRGTDIPSEPLTTCVDETASVCPPVRGIDLVGSPEGDKIKGTKGDDTIRSRGGDDNLDLRQGGTDHVNCGKGKDLVRLTRRFTNDQVVIRGSCEKVKQT